MQPLLPAAVQTAFYLAGVVPVFIAGLNREAWLSSQATSHGQEVLLIDEDIKPERLVEVADWALTESAARLTQTV